MKEKLRELAQVREEIARQREKIKIRQSDLEITVEWLLLETEKNRARLLEAKADLLTAEIKSNEYSALVPKVDGGFEKPTTDGIGMRAKHSVLFDDKDAREWCIKNAPHYLIVEKPVFTKAALDANKGKNAKPFSCVKYIDDVEITIAADLSGYLEGNHE